MDLPNKTDRPMRYLSLATRRRQGGNLMLRLLIAVFGTVVGWLLGQDIAGAEMIATSQRLHTLLLPTIAPLPLAAIGALYHEPLHAQLLSFPVSAWQHFRYGVALMLSRHGVWIFAVIGIGVGAASRLAPESRFVLGTMGAITFVSGFCFSVACAALCASVGDSDQAWLANLRRSTAGIFASERHAPFFYLPAVAYGLTAIGALFARAGLLSWQAGQLDRALPLIVGPLLCSVLLLAWGIRGYTRHGLRTIARVAEEQRTVFGGKPAPVDPPYGQRLSRLLPSSLRPHYAKELREQTRAARAVWPAIALVWVGITLYAAGASSARSAPLVAALLVIWFSTLPLRRRVGDDGERWLRTLPIGAGLARLGQLLALTFVSAHVTLPIILALALRHNRAAALLVLAVAAASLTVAIRLRHSERHRQTAVALLIAAAACGLFATTSITLLLAAIALLALTPPLRPTRCNR